MSPAAARRLDRSQRHLCRECRVRPARFRYHGQIRADRDHDLCFRCFRAETNRQRARRIAPVDGRPPGGAAAPSDASRAFRGMEVMAWLATQN